MNLIVTGGAGFIGANFVYYELRTHPEDRIVCYDVLTYAGNIATLDEAKRSPNFTFVRGDIADRAAVYALFEREKPDVVINFAAESHVDRSIENPEIFLQTNIIGTSILLDACRKYGITRYHQVSTDEVYGDLPLDRPDLFFTEETPLHTSSPYSSSKAGADLLVQAYARTYGIPVSISRCSNNYGAFQLPGRSCPSTATVSMCAIGSMWTITARRSMPSYAGGTQGRSTMSAVITSDRISTSFVLFFAYLAKGRSSSPMLRIARGMIAAMPLIPRRSGAISAGSRRPRSRMASAARFAGMRNIRNGGKTS